ncbi:MAG TPA: AbrB/MazE/SpoVT family DNA-binding domain-containing protein [Candidatus Omnitrophota bacterium]|nr:AbrB/MazE/SpoVT family DNA-binding domain-containing protein [Candidatus Omnitrophota bacterium]HPT07118.1 AbrB/MazE/SpoVT family DNA-binding domain-containing protein [Candidatus Omnitrophota bacterium]
MDKTKKSRGAPRFFGKVPVGSKGQIVIPREARQAMGIGPGDQVVIISGPPHEKRMISLIPEEEFNKFLAFMEEHVTMIRKESLK